MGFNLVALFIGFMKNFTVTNKNRAQRNLAMNKKRELPPRAHVKLPMLLCEGAKRQRTAVANFAVSFTAIINNWDC